VHLVDSHHCSDDSKFLSTALVALSAMTMLEMPHVNVLSKIDRVQCMGRKPPPPPPPPATPAAPIHACLTRTRAVGRLHFDLSFYTRSDNLSKIPEILVRAPARTLCMSNTPFAPSHVSKTLPPLPHRVSSTYWEGPLHAPQRADARPRPPAA